MLEVRFADDPAIAVRRAESVARTELFEPNNPQSSLREMEKRRAPHRSKSDDYCFITA